MPSSDVTDCTAANSSQSVELPFAKLTENAVKPTRGSELAAGFDLHRLIKPNYIGTAICWPSSHAVLDAVTGQLPDGKGYFAERGMRKVVNG